MKKHTAKKEGIGLEFKAFKGRSKKSYIVFRTLKGSYHTFAEVDAKEAAIDCGAPIIGNTRVQWKAVWDAYEMRKIREPIMTGIETERSGADALASIRARLARTKNS